MDLVPQILTFVFALSMAVFLTPVARAVAFRLGILDQPNQRKIHLTPTPLLGGLVIYAAVVVGLLISVNQQTLSRVFALVTGSTLMVLVGLIDDRRPLNSTIKLTLAIPFAGLILAAGGMRATAFPLSRLLNSQAPELAVIVSFLLTILWVVVVTSSFAILDHMDGLCSGVAAVASGFFLTFAVLEGQFLVTILSAAMLGANLGFLKWNLKPASIFMGDSGALFVGFMMSALAISLSFNSLSPHTSWMIPVLLLGIPIFDSSLVVLSRLRRGLAPHSWPGKDHAAHRLANLGLGESRAVILLLAVQIMLGGLALLVRKLTIPEAYVLAAVLAVGGLAAVIWLERAPYDRQ